MKKNIIIATVIAILAGGIAFWGGMAYGQNKAGRAQGQRFSQFGQRNGNIAGVKGAGFGAGASSGSIIGKDDKTITIKLMDGGSKIVFYSATTQVGKFVQGSAADLQVGQTVMINGQTNSDGSLTANNIQIRPVSATGTFNPGKTNQE